MRLALLDTLHERVLPSWVLALGFLLLGLPMARATGMGAPTRVALDFALWWVWLYGCATALWLGSRCIARPLDARTAAWELAGPVSVTQWALQRVGAAALVSMGGFCGLAAVGLGLAGLPAGWWAFGWLTVVEIVLLCALTAWLGSLFRPLPALALGTALWASGHLAGIWLDVMAQSGAGGPGAVFLALIPDLDLLDTHAAVVHGAPPSAGEVLAATGWGTAWICAAGAATVAVLQRRDLA